jgi:hypothetical protein
MTKYKCVFLKKEYDRYVKIKEKGFHVGDEEISYKNKTFHLKDLKTLYHDKKKAYIYIDFETEKIINFEGVGQHIDAKIADLIISKHILAQIFTQLNPLGEGAKGYLVLVMGLAIGALSGYLVGNMYAPNHTVIKYLNSTSGGIPTTIAIWLRWKLRQ